MMVHECTQAGPPGYSREPVARVATYVEPGALDTSGCAQQLSRVSAWHVVEMASSIWAESWDPGSEVPGGGGPTRLHEIQPCPDSEGTVMVLQHEWEGT